jgi:complement component 1 Q subcomponent-binding protein
LQEEDFDDLAEGEFGEHAAANQGQPGQAVGVHPEDQLSPADRDYDETAPASFPVRVSITIEKPGKGALLIHTAAQDGVFEIEDVYHFAKAELANAETAEKDWTRQRLYGGPIYSNLDEDLQALFERYLEERGFDAELANFIPDYITVKEQKEYARWLDSKYTSLLF